MLDEIENLVISKSAKNHQFISELVEIERSFD